jgi:hypothetical protein
MKTVRFVTLAAAAAAFSLPALAQTSSTQRIDQRQANQEKRIEQGEKSGALTPREARRLERGQRHVQKMENRAMKDGKVTRGEARRIQRAQNAESRRIYRQKHDRQQAK